MSLRPAFLARMLLSSLVAMAGALFLLLLALATGLRAPRLYREGIASPLGRIVLAIWGIRLVRRGDWPADALPLRPAAVLRGVLRGFPGGRPPQRVYVSNHTSTIDLFVLLALGLPDTRFFLSGFLRKLPPFLIIGTIVGIFWTVPQERQQERRAIFARAARELARTGESVYLSPEGARITTGQIGPFNRGAFHLAASLGAPIVPLFIRIPPECDPGLGLDAKPGTVEVFAAAPIDTRDWRSDEIDRHRDAMQAFYVDWHRELSAGRAS